MSRRGTKPKAASKPLPGAESSKRSKPADACQASSPPAGEKGQMREVESGASNRFVAWGRLLELAVLLGCLAYAIWFWLRLPARLPDEKDYLALQAALKSEAQAGDGAAVLPFWADRAKIFLHGVPVLALPHLEAEADAERYGRLWVIAQPDLPRSDARDSLKALGERLALVEGPRRFGPLELWLFAPRPGRAATYDFVAHADEAQTQSPGRLQAEWREFDFLPRRCILSRNGFAVMHFDSVHVRGGLRVGLGSLGPSEGSAIQVSVDGRPLQPLQFVQGGPAFQEAELPAGGLTGEAHSVDLTLIGRAVCADAVAF
jgi:hypothetical protein